MGLFETPKEALQCLYKVNKCVSELGLYPIEAVYTSLQYKGVSIDLIIHTVQNYTGKTIREDALSRKLVCKMVADYRKEGLDLSVTKTAYKLGFAREYFYENVKVFNKDIETRPGSKEAVALADCQNLLTRNLYE